MFQKIRNPIRNTIFCFLLLLTNEMAGQNAYIDSLRLAIISEISDSNRVVAVNRLGWAYRTIDLDTAMYYLRQSMDLARETPYEEYIGRSTGNIGAIYYFMGEYENAEKYVREAIDFFKGNNPTVEHTHRNTLSVIYRKQGNFKGSREQLELALDYFETSKDSHRLAAVLNNLGGHYSEQGNASEAMNYYFRAAEIKETIGDYRNAATTYGNIGDIQRTNGDLESALFFLKKALNLVDKYQLESYRGMIQNNLAAVYLEKGDTLQATQLYEQALENNLRLKSLDGQSTTLLRLGEIYTLTGKYDKGIEYLNRSLDLIHSQDKVILLSSAYNALGRAYYKKGNIPGAIRYYELSLNTEEDVSNSDIRQITVNRLSELYAISGDYKKAYEAKLESYQILDSLKGEERMRAMAELTTRYETREKEKKLAEQELTIAKEKNAQKNILIGSLMLLFLVGGVLTYLRYRAVVNKNKAQKSLLIKEAEAARLQEMNTLRSNFFANISHEFRTPITLILSPIEQMINGTLKGDPKRYLVMVQQNARRLLSLVNQILDISRIESGVMPLRVKITDIRKAVAEIVHAFQSKADSDNIQLTLELPPGKLSGFIDREILQNTLSNLLSNALKYTPHGGKILVGLANANGEVSISVSDNGDGIRESDLPQVFNRYFRASQEASEVSSGIGLSLTKELMELHHGKVTVKSEFGQGSEFTLHFPIKMQAYAATERAEQSLPDDTSRNESLTAPIELQDKQLVLVVEDNEEVRNYIAEQLEETYAVIQAVDGKEGLELAKSNIPDLIITDVMMPKMDGRMLAREIRRDMATSHIPLIMLTAKAEPHDRIEGIKSGAELYLTKPFDLSELLLRVESMIGFRDRLKEKYQKDALFVPEGENLENADTTFLRKVHNLILENLDKEDFSVEGMSEQLHMSRSTLHRKLRSLTGYGPNELIRHMRLETGRELLQKGFGVSEVAFKVGFSSLAYFSRSFKIKYGHSPSEVEKSRN